MFVTADQDKQTGLSFGVAAAYCVMRLDGRVQTGEDPEKAMQALKALFPSGKADAQNLVLFSTSGTHGAYDTIEKVASDLKTYGDDPMRFNEHEEPVRNLHGMLTVTVLHPRTICMKYGRVRVRLADVAWLKKLRASSWRALAEIGK